MSRRAAPVGGATGAIVDPQAIVAAIERLLQARAPDATICPSEVARALVGDVGPWRALMPEVREVAGRLVREGRLRVTRRGAEVDVQSAGPIRLGAPPRLVES